MIHKTTLQQLFSVNSPDFPTATWIINPDLSGLGGVPKKYWTIAGDTVVEMTQPEKDVVDAAELVVNKAQRCVDTDANSVVLIETAGFTHAAKIFSLNAEAQLNWINIGLNPMALGFPYDMTLQDPATVHTFADLAEIQTAYTAAAARRESVRSLGRDLKVLINAAVDQAALDAIVDDRT